MKMQRDYLYIVLAIVITSMISVSAHVFILQYFPNAPELNIDPTINQIFVIAIRFCTVIASMFIYLNSKEYWEKINPVPRVILFTILILALTESLLRTSLMAIIVGVPWMYQVLITFPLYLEYLSLSLIICLLVHAASEKKKFRFLRYSVLAILATILFIFVRMIGQYFVGHLLAYLPHPMQPTPHQFPYGESILIPAYITFLEPTIASFIVFYLIRKSLSAFNTLTKGLIMAAIIITIHAGIYSILEIACSKGNFFYRIFYYGQFLWEYLTLGILTAYSFKLFRKLTISH